MAGRIPKIPLSLRSKSYTINTYRRAKTHLLKCYQERCGYSMIHMNHLGGAKEMEVDHFDPRTKTLRRQPYSAFVLSSGHCNRSKGDTWPTEEQIAKGIRFINPRDEWDYGPHIKVDDRTGEVIGATPAGIFQIRVCDLNAPHLVRLRFESIVARKGLKGPIIWRLHKEEKPLNLIPTLRLVAEVFPPAPSVSGGDC